MRWALVLAAGLLVAALAGVYAVLMRYEPLHVTAVGHGPLRYREGGETWYAVTLRNGGRLPVRVTRVNLAPPARRKPLLVRTDVALGRTPESAVPFRAFSLGRGEQRDVLVRGHFANCEAYPANGGTARDVQRLWFRVLALVPSRQDVVLPKPIVIEAPPDARCPARS